MPDTLTAPDVATRLVPRPARRRPQSSDEALMALAQGGDVAAFGDLFDRHVGLAVGITRRICGPDQAEDAAQAAFLSAWKGRGSFSPAAGSFRSWLCRISHNRALDHMRARRLHAVATTDDGDVLERHLGRESRDEDPPALELERSDEGSEMRAALSRLPKAQREVIVLAYFGGMTHLEIATALALPAGTVKGRMRLALTRLRRDPHVLARWSDPVEGRKRCSEAHP